MLELLKKLGIAEPEQQEILKVFNQEVGKAETLKTQLEEKATELNNTLEKYKDYDNLKSDLEKAKEDITGYTTKLEEAEKTHKTILNDTILQKEIEKELLKNNVQYADLLIDKFDKTALKIKDGLVEGLDKQIDAFKKSHPALFVEPNNLTGQAPATNVQSPEFLDVNAMNADDVANNWDKIKSQYSRR